MGVFAGKAALADRNLPRVIGNFAGRARGNRAGGDRAATARDKHFEPEGSAADATLHRFSLREAGDVAQDYGERSTSTVCDQIEVQLSRPGGAATKRVAVGAGRIQGGVVCGWARQSPDLAHGSERRHFSGGERSRTHPSVS